MYGDYQNYETYLFSAAVNVLEVAICQKMQAKARVNIALY